MTSTLKRIGMVAALGATAALAPVTSASADPPAAPPGIAPIPGTPFVGVPGFVGPSVGGITSVIGPTILIVGPGNVFDGVTLTVSGAPAVVGTANGP